MSDINNKESINFNGLNHDQKVNCIKNLLYSKNLISALNIILEKEKKDLELINIIIDCSSDELIAKKIKENLYLNPDSSIKLYLYSKIISILSFYNKKIILKKLFDSLDNDLLKQIAIYEYTNKTEVSNSSEIFNKYCHKYKKEALEKLKNSDEEILELTMEFNKFNNLTNKKNNKVLISLIVVVVILLCSLIGYKWNLDTKILNKYKGTILPGIYLNDISLEGMNYKALSKLVESEAKKIMDGKITISNVNGSLDYSYNDVGIEVTPSVEEEIINYNKNISRFKRLSMIKNNKKYKTFKLEGSLNDEKLSEFMKKLSNDINKDAKEDSFYVDKNHNVVYDGGANGFTLNVSETKKEIESKLNKLSANTKVEAKGDIKKVDIKYDKYKEINKKVSTYTTYFANVGNRGHNIVHAASKLNGTLLMPGETFSYLKKVGPFTGNGYLPAPVYINSENATANGGGVCQLSSTLYMANLYAGLEIVSRRPHTFAATYVPKGLDATVYSPTTDYKFKNNYDYPIYVVSYVSGNYLTVDIWTNDKALGNYTYEPYSYYSNGGYEAYLKVFENGKYKTQRYLGRSKYKAH